MNKYVSKVFLIFIVITLVVSIAACGASSVKGTDSATTAATTSTQGTEQPQEKAPVTLRVSAPDSPGEKQNVMVVADEFVKKYPYVKIEIEPIVGDMIAKAIAQAASGEMADVTWVFSEIVANFVDGGVLGEVDSYLDEVGVDRDDVYPAMLSQGTINGKIYMVPRDYNHVSTFVNTTIIKDAGLEMPKDDWTWNQFVDYVKKTTKKDSAGKTIQWGLMANTFWAPVYESFTQMFGVKPLDYTNKKSNFSDPNVVKGLKELLDLTKEGYAIDPLGQYPEDMFNAGKVAFQFMVKPRCTDINEAAKAKGFDWDVLEFPQTENPQVVGVGTSGYGIYAKSKNIKEAGLFVAFFATTEGQKAFSKSGNCVPVLKSLKDDSVWRDNPVPGKNQGAFVANPQRDAVALFTNMIPKPMISDAQTSITDAMSSYLLGKSSLEDALKAADEKINKLWADIK